MKTVTDQLSKYATYHRDRRNIATHFVGVPMIFFAVVTLLSRPVLFSLGGLPISLAVVAGIGASLFYLLLDVRLGLAMTALTALAIWVGINLAVQSTMVWLIAGAGGFVVGWVIQFVGHYYEGKKPAFVDDIVGLLIGPLFVVTEWAFRLGLRKPLLHEIEQRAGPTHIRDLRAAAPAP